MRELRPERVHSPDLRGLDQVQHLDHGEALSRRRGLEDLDVAVPAGKRFAPGRALGREVGRVEEPAAGARERGERAGGIAAVEALAAAVRDALEHECETEVYELLAGARSDAAGREDRERARVERSVRGVKLDSARKPPGDGKALARVADRGREVARERQPAVLLVGGAP